MALFCEIIPHNFRQNKTLYPPQCNYNLTGEGCQVIKLKK